MFSVMKNKLTALSVFLLLTVTAFAQTDEDAFRYAQITFGGTARNLATGGAFSALGGDVSTLSNNPAGIGIFQHGQFTFSPSFVSVKTNSLFLDNNEEDRKYNFNIGNLGIVWSKQLDAGKSDWRNFNFGFVMNRQSNYHSRVAYNGYNENNSLSDYFAEEANGTLPSQVADKFPFDAGLAGKTGLIWYYQGDSMNYHGVTLDKGIQQQRNTVTRGRLNEYDFSFGGNYKDKLYIGGTIGIPDLEYENETDHNEQDKNNLIPDFKSFTYSQSYNTSGSGVNAKFGLIFRPNDYVRIGAAVHSPTYFYLTDKYYSSVKSDLDSSGVYTANSPTGTFNYNLTTPWRVMGGIAVLFKKYGFISADYEWLDYSEAFFSTRRNASSDDKTYLVGVNQNINAKYGPASNIRVGGEFVYDVFRFRLGYALYGSPFQVNKAAKDYDFSSRSYTGGIGMMDGNYFLDLGFARTESKQFQQPYSLSNMEVPGAKISQWQSNFIATMGIKF